MGVLRHALSFWCNMDIRHGNCLSVLDELEPGSVDLLLTDPPYGNNAAYGKTDKRIIANDQSPLIGLLALQKSYRLLKINTVSYFFCDIRHLPLIRTYIEHYTDFVIREYVVWNKVHFGLGSAFRKQHELILVLDKGSPTYTAANLGNVISTPRVSAKDHPHEKPVDLLRQLIRHASSPGAVVLDPFMGSGASAVAALAEGRRYIGIEICDAYVQLAIRRVRDAARPAPGSGVATAHT